MEHPNIDNPSDPNSLVPAAIQTKLPVAEKDFIVFFHWGGVKMLVDTTTGRRRTPDTARYRDDLDATPTGGRLLYRLSELPAEEDRKRHHVLTDAHYERARTLFADLYEFLKVEYSCRDTFLGPTERILGVTRDEEKEKTRQQADQDDRGAVTGEVGSIAGFVIHPDYPLPNSDGRNNGRQAHDNHIHVNLGLNDPVRRGGTYEK